MKKLLAFATAGLIATGAFAQAPAAAPTDAPRNFDLACAQNECWLERR